jgi:hypothetical protein
MIMVVPILALPLRRCNANFRRSAYYESSRCCSHTTAASFQPR